VALTSVTHHSDAVDGAVVGRRTSVQTVFE